MKVEVVGKGAEARKLLDSVRKALRELGVEAEVLSVGEKPGVLVEPALIVDGKLLLEGEAGPYGKVKRLLERSCGGS